MLPPAYQKILDLNQREAAALDSRYNKERNNWLRSHPKADINDYYNSPLGRTEDAEFNKLYKIHDKRINQYFLDSQPIKPQKSEPKHSVKKKTKSQPAHEWDKKYEQIHGE
jgi:hypothetical protein